jgi:hypothetical protein
VRYLPSKSLLSFKKAQVIPRERARVVVHLVVDITKDVQSTFTKANGTAEKSKVLALPKAPFRKARFKLSNPLCKTSVREPRCPAWVGSPAVISQLHSAEAFRTIIDTRTCLTSNRTSLISTL